MHDTLCILQKRRKHRMHNQNSGLWHSSRPQTHIHNHPTQHHARSLRPAPRHRAPGHNICRLCATWVRAAFISQTGARSGAPAVTVAPPRPAVPIQTHETGAPLGLRRWHCNIDHPMHIHPPLLSAQPPTHILTHPPTHSRSTLTQHTHSPTHPPHLGAGLEPRQPSTRPSCARSTEMPSPDLPRTSTSTIRASVPVVRPIESLHPAAWTCRQCSGAF